MALLNFTNRFAKVDLSQAHRRLAENTFEWVDAEIQNHLLWPRCGVFGCLVLADEMINDGQQFATQGMGEEAIVAYHAEIFIGYVADEAGDKILSRATEGTVRFGVVIEIAKGDILAVVMNQFGLSNRWTAEISADVFDVLVMIFAWLLTINVPVCGAKFIQ